MLFALSLALTHTLSVASLVAVVTALAVVGIVVGAPDSGAGGEEGAPAGGDAGTEGSEDATRDGGDDGGREADGDRRAAGGGDDDDDDVDADLPAEIRDDPKRLRTHLRRTQRQFGKVRPIAERFRDPSTGQYMQPQQIDRMLGRSQDMEELETFFADNPDIVQAIVERRQGGARRPGAADPDAWVDPFAKEDDLPWDTTTPEGKKFLELFRDGNKTQHELRTQIKRLEGQLGQVNQRDTTRTLAGIESTWKTSTLAAANKVPAEYRENFVTSVWRAFELAKTKRQLGKVRVDQIIERELKPYVRATRGAQRSTAAGAQRTAEHNTTIPRPGARGTTSAADPNASNKGVGTIRDGRKSFFSRLGMQPSR